MGGRVAAGRRSKDLARVLDVRRDNRRFEIEVRLVELSSEGAASARCA